MVLSSVSDKQQEEAEYLLHPEVPIGEGQFISVCACLFPLTIDIA